VEIPFAGGRMFGWLLLPPGPVAGTVVVFGGQSGWGPAYLRQADALNRRGLAALLAEGPGQGRTRMEGRVRLDVDVRAELGPVGLWGNSNGGLYAGTTAASDRRVAAVCVNGAPARPRLLTFRSYAEQAAAMLGTDDRVTIQENFDRIALRPEDRIGCPVLVLHGGEDPLVGLDEQQPFLDAAAHHGDTRPQAMGVRGRAPGWGSGGSVPRRSATPTTANALREHTSAIGWSTTADRLR
jgi:alpha-beta hydrolase superfamily lysophospholipase